MGSAGKKLRTRMDIGKDIQNCLDDLNNMTHLEFITHQPYDAMGDFSFLLDEKSDKAENSTVENENMNAD